MITTRLKTIFALSIPLFIAHGVEEFITGFYNVDAWDQAIFSPIASLSVHGAMFATFQIMLWLLLIVSLLLLINERTRLYMLGIVGLIYLFELHHVVKAITVGGYYPGLLTAVFFPIFAYFFWKEWLHVRSITKNS